MKISLAASRSLSVPGLPVLVTFVVVSCLAVAWSPVAQSGEVAAPAYFSNLLDSPHLEVISESITDVTDHEIGLGALKKVRGVWQFKNSERLSGELATYTWKIHDAYTSLEVLTDIEKAVAESGKAELLFSCDGRACGSGAQWASRVFGQRLLYGREDLQRYRVYRVTDAEGFEKRVLLFAAARSAERQYLHAEVLAITP